MYTAVVLKSIKSSQKFRRNRIWLNVGPAGAEAEIQFVPFEISMTTTDKRTDKDSENGK